MLYITGPLEEIRALLNHHEFNEGTQKLPQVFSSSDEALWSLFLRNVAQMKERIRLFDAAVGDFRGRHPDFFKKVVQFDKVMLSQSVRKIAYENPENFIKLLKLMATVMEFPGYAEGIDVDFLGLFVDSEEGAKRINTDLLEPLPSPDLMV